MLSEVYVCTCKGRTKPRCHMKLQGGKRAVRKSVCAGLHPQDAGILTMPFPPILRLPQTADKLEGRGNLSRKISPGWISSIWDGDALKKCPTRMKPSLQPPLPAAALS